MHGEDDELDDETMRRHDRVPRSGLPVVAPESGSHQVGRRTPRSGVPSIVERQSAAYDVVSPDDVPPDALTARVQLAARLAAQLEVQRAHSAFRKALVAVAVAALGALGTVIVWALNSREEAGDERARMRYLERGFERLVNDVYRLRLHADEPDHPDAVTRPTPRVRPDANTGATP